MHRFVPSARGLLQFRQGRRIPGGLGDGQPDLGAGILGQHRCEFNGIRDARRDRQRRVYGVGGRERGALDRRMIANRLRRVVVDQAEQASKGFGGDLLIA